LAIGSAIDNYNFIYREICIEFNHSQLEYYTELDAVSISGILNYPENGELDMLLTSGDTDTSSRQIFGCNKDEEILSCIRKQSIPPNVICWTFSTVLATDILE